MRGRYSRTWSIENAAFCSSATWSTACTQSAGLPGCGACRWSWLGRMRRGAPVGRFTSKRSALTSSIPYSASGRQGIDRSPRGELAHVGRHASRGAFRRRSSDGPSVGSTKKGRDFGDGQEDRQGRRRPVPEARFLSSVIVLGAAVVARDDPGVGTERGQSSDADAGLDHRPRLCISLPP